MQRSRIDLRAIAPLFLSLSLLAGCNTVQDLVTITLGEGDIDPVELDATYELGSIDRTICPTGMYTVPDPSGDTYTITLMSVGSGCRIALPDVDVVIFDEQQTREVSNQLDGFEVDGVRSARIHATEFVLSDAMGNPIRVPETVSDFELSSDGEVIFTAADLPAARAGTLEKDMPMTTLNRLKAAVENQTEAHARLGLTLTVPTFENLPASVHIRTVVQPIVDVNVIDAVI